MKIRKVKDETPKVKTIIFEDEMCKSAQPGQFVMLWIPSVDEIPLSLSSNEVDHPSVTVAEVGEATEALNSMKEGDLIGLRGPLGNHFKPIGKTALVVGGGTGIAPLMMLTRGLVKRSIKTTIIEGVETKNDLLFLDCIKDLILDHGLEAVFTTEDGSYGTKGMATDAAERLLASNRFDVIYTCGPEKMILKVHYLAKEYKTSLQASLERLMRCAVGICGSCVIGKYRVCKDGPVFDQRQLGELGEELGRFRRDYDGERIPI